MLNHRKAEERGHANFGWLDSRHSFSFGSYFDPKHMGFGPLRVINDDRVAGGGGFPTHPHADMEIVTYVLEGALEHKDSLGTGSVIRPGDVQRMSAGTGIRHSEFNASKSDPVHLLQIWIMPRARDLPSGYEQKAFTEDERRGRLRLVASEDEREESVTIQQDARLYAGILAPGSVTEHKLAADRYGWAQVARGNVELNGVAMNQGDGAAIRDEDLVKLAAEDQAEVLLFDLA